jgi:hypothetical protein
VLYYLDAVIVVYAVGSRLPRHGRAGLVRGSNHGVESRSVLVGGHPMTTLAEVEQLNRALAEKINAEARGNPNSPYAGKFVGIANGQVVAVTDELDDLARRVRAAEPDARRTFFVEASRDYDAVIEI